MKGRGDAIGDKLAVGILQRQRDVEADAWPRHDLSLEAVAVDIDDSRKHEQAVGIDHGCMGRPDL